MKGVDQVVVHHQEFIRDTEKDVEQDTEGREPRAANRAPVVC